MVQFDREREREREREIILLRSIVHMMIHVQIQITMKDYVDWSKETCVKTLKIASTQATLTPCDYST